LDEETVTQQTAAKTAGERQHKHTDEIVVTPDGHHRSGYAEKNRRSQRIKSSFSQDAKNRLTRYGRNYSV
jgi:hypothetical protein